MHFCILANHIFSFVACKVTLVQDSTLEYVPKLNRLIREANIAYC